MYNVSLILRFKAILIISSFIISTLFVSISNNSTALSIWNQDSFSDFENGTLNNISIIGSGYDVELKIEFNNCTWVDVDPQNYPSSRFHAAKASIYNTDKLIIFGGSYSWAFTYFNDTYEYDLSNNTWINKNPKRSTP